MHTTSIKVEDIEPVLGVSLRLLYNHAVDLYAPAYKLVVKTGGSPHPGQYQQGIAIECSGDPAHDRRELPSDIDTLFNIFQQARVSNGGFPPDLGTLAQAQASGMALSRALGGLGFPDYQVY